MTACIAVECHSSVVDEFVVAVVVAYFSAPPHSQTFSS